MEPTAPSKRWRGSAVLAAVLIAVVIVLMPAIIEGGSKLFLQRVFDSLNNGAVYAVTAIALVLIFKATNLINFAQANIAMFGAYVCWWLAVTHGWPVWVAIALSMAIMAAGAATAERTLLRRFDPSDHLPVVLITFGLAAVLRSVAGGVWGLEFRQFPSPFPAEPEDRFTVNGAFLRYETVGTIVVMVLMVAVLALVLNRTRIGLTFRGVSSNPQSAALCGVRTGRVLQFAWALAAALGVLGATMVARQTNLEPGFMERLIIFAFAAACLGGPDSILGAIVGAFLVAIVQSLVTGYGQEVPGFGWMSSNLALVIAFAVILVVLVFRPSGLFGTSRVERV